MERIELKNRVANIATEWKDLSVWQYILLTDLYAESQELVEEDFLIKFLLIISDLDREFLESLYEDELTPFVGIIQNFDMSKFKGEKVDHFVINDKIYSYNPVAKLTLGEKVSLKLLEKKSQSQTETWLNLLAIMIRPAEKKVNEFDEIYYEVIPFEGDVEILNKRKELLKNIKAVNGFHLIEGFIDGRK